jgi:retinol dehydrogenase 12
MPDLTGQMIIVTGGNSFVHPLLLLSLLRADPSSAPNSGIGLETIHHLLLKNATVYMTVRSLSKGEAANEELSRRTGGKEAKLLELDLADLRSVRRAAEVFVREVGMRE